MAFRRRYVKKTYKKRTYKRKYTRKTYGKKRGTSKVLCIKQTQTQPPLQCGLLASTPTTAQYNFTVNTPVMDNWSSFESLYEKWRVKKLVVRFEPRANINTMSSATEPSSGPNVVYYQGSIHSAIYSETRGPPINVQDCQQYQTYKRTRINRAHKRVIYPKVMIPTVDNNSTGVTGRMAVPASKYWFDFANSGIELYGLLVYVDPISTSVLTDPYNFDVYVDYYLEFKGLS